VDPDRVDAARVVLLGDRLRARGTSCAPDHTVTWRLDTGPGWATRALEVHCMADDGDRRLELRRDDTGGWTGRRWEDGRPVDADLPDLTDAADCDLGLCPLTNTMPLLRSGLLDRPHRTVRFTMAWVSVPDLVVHASVQDYGPAVRRDDGGAVVRFASPGFTADLTVDRDGLVVAYPGLADRVVG
jgi:hypothetical protein